MLNKRGIGQEIDWIIGVGLFLLSMAFIFVLFKPGITPVYDSQTLLDILQNGFRSDTNFEITSAPIFVYPANSSYLGQGLIVLSDNMIDVSCMDSCSTEDFTRLNDLISEKNKSNMEYFYIKRDEGDMAPTLGKRAIDDEAPIRCEEKGGVCEDKELGDGGLLLEEDEYPIKVDRSDPMKYLLEDSILTVGARLDDGVDGQPVKTKYLLTVSDKEINFVLDDFAIVEPPLQACYKAGVSDWPHSDAVAELCPIIYDLGLTETLSGIDIISFNALNRTAEIDCGAGYECIKEKWGFPASKEFVIYIENLPSVRPTPRIYYTFPKSLTPPENVNVFVRQFNDFVITDDGTRIPVSVRIIMW